jgi:transcriptional regulator with XRE-family HTH domain
LGVKHTTLNRLLSNLKQLRRFRGLTQEKFAEQAGFSYKYYQAVEAGRKRDLRLSTLDRLAKAYKMDVTELLAIKLPIPEANRFLNSIASPDLERAGRVKIAPAQKRAQRKSKKK